MLNRPEFRCRVCGMLQVEPTWDSYNCPSHDICSCCGIEFGYEDCKLDSIRKARDRWVGNGANWWEAKEKPIDWSYVEQLKDIPEEYK